MKKIYYRKLVRDKIPERIRAKGESCSTRTLSAAEFEHELFKKLLEEVREVKAAGGRTELIEELADVEEVLAELRALKKIDSKQVRKQQGLKRTKKGGLKERVFLLWSSNVGYLPKPARKKRN